MSAPPGALTESSPGQTDRMVAALAKATATARQSEPDTDAEVLSAPLAEADARELDTKIRLMAGQLVSDWAKLRTLVEQAQTGQIHAALGYPSWTAYVADVGGQLKVTRDIRPEVVELLASAGMSQRAIAAVTGVSQATVSRDLSGDSDESPDADNNRDPAPAPPTTGMDGKTYPKRKVSHAAQPLTATFRRRLEASRAAVIKLHRIAEADTFDPTSLAEDAEAIRMKIDAAISALTEVRARLESVGGEDQ